MTPCSPLRQGPIIMAYPRMSTWFVQTLADVVARRFEWALVKIQNLHEGSNAHVVGKYLFDSKMLIWRQRRTNTLTAITMWFAIKNWQVSRGPTIPNLRNCWILHDAPQFVKVGCSVSRNIHKVVAIRRNATLTYHLPPTSYYLPPNTCYSILTT